MEQENKKENKQEEKNNKFDFNEIFFSKGFKIGIAITGFAVFVLLILQLGMMIGFQKANFSYKWENNYPKNFMMPREFPMGEPGLQPKFMNSHGIAGDIIKINETSLVIKDVDTLEKVILIDKNTSIRKTRDNMNIGDLRVDDKVVVIGNPNELGEIEAKLIRVMPEIEKQLQPGIRLESQN